MKFQPVAVLTTVYTMLLAILGTAAITELLPPVLLVVLTGIASVLGVVLGVATYNRVTPIARPVDGRGRPLAPRNGA